MFKNKRHITDQSNYFHDYVFYWYMNWIYQLSKAIPWIPHILIFYLMRTHAKISYLTVYNFHDYRTYSVITLTLIRQRYIRIPRPFRIPWICRNNLNLHNYEAGLSRIHVIFVTCCIQRIIVIAFFSSKVTKSK